MKSSIFMVLLVAGMQLNAQTPPAKTDTLNRDKSKDKQFNRTDTTKYPKRTYQQNDGIRKDTTRIPK